MSNNRVFWLWLHAVLGPCSAKLIPMLDLFGSVEEIYQKRESPLFIQYLAPGEIKRAREITREQCAALAETCDHSGIFIVCYSDESYPARLRKTGVPPTVLFVTGAVSALSAPFAVAGVGARFSTQYGREAVKHICTPLAKAGICLVSGLAYGIDAEVHKVALQCGSPTVAVLGTPIDVTYPASHETLRKQIEQSGGAVVSEYMPGTVIGKQMFTQRNRIVSGLSQGVIIVEAAKKSGTMVTATWALDDGREVFAVPGSILSPHSEGTNYLIKQGATPALSALEILESLNLLDLHYEQTALEPPQTPVFSPTQQKIHDALEQGSGTVDTLTQATGLAPHVVLAELTALEMDGIIQPVAGSRYALKL